MAALQDYMKEANFNRHIDEIRGAFELCTNYNDVQEVIGEIPNKYGDFSVELRADDGMLYAPSILDDDEEMADKVIIGFRITNAYSQYDDYAEDQYDFDWFD